MTKEYIVIAFTENQIGVLNRITALYLRRKINIESLKVSESSIRGISMFVISAFTTRETIDKLVKQLRNIIDVIQVEYYSNEELITQEIALYKITSKIFRESGGYILSRTNMKALQEILPEESFLRIHRSYIVPIDRVEMFSKKKIKLAGQETLLPVGRQFANHIYDLLIARNSGGSRTNL